MTWPLTLTFDLDLFYMGRGLGHHIFQHVEYFFMVQIGIFKLNFERLLKLLISK